MKSESEKVPFGVSLRIGQLSPVAHSQFCLAAMICFSTLDVKGRLARLRDLRRSVFDSFSSASRADTGVASHVLFARRRCAGKGGPYMVRCRHVRPCVTQRLALTSLYCSHCCQALAAKAR
jgi:hypothetical protein